MMKKTISIVLTLCMVLSFVLPASALTVAGKPENGTTVGQPFATGTGGSTNFRIPGIVTLDNGTLVAACDARWNHSGDGAGLDSIVSVSTDNGANWTYTFANYLGDNGDTYNNLSTCIIDPGIGTDGEKAYLIADLWPAGIALNTSRYSPVAGENGFDANGNLILRDLDGDTVTIGQNGYNTMAASRPYNYYLNLADLCIYTSSGTKVEGYTVDAHFNITGTDGTNTNLFFADSPYQPYPTDYLYMTTSTDGLNWSAPTLLNLQEDAEQTLLVGPGNGTYDAVNDRVIFTAYEHSSGYERTSLIWMDAQGNWKRSEDCTVNNWSSEASSVVLDDGTVRVFYRDGFAVLRYTDMVWSEAQQNYVRDAAATEVSTMVPKDPGCQLTAIMHSKQIDGKDVILVATPTVTRRKDGYIYAFLVNADKSMELLYKYDITPGATEAYAYSCLTELSNGDLGLLWEGDNPDTNGGAEIIYFNIPMADVTARENNVNLTFKTIDIYTEETAFFTDNTGNYENADVSGLDTDVATVEIKGETVVSNVGQTLGTNANVMLEDCLFTFTASGDNYVISRELSDGAVVYLNHFGTTNNNIPLTTSSNTVKVEAAANDMFKLVSQVVAGSSGNKRSLHFHMEYADPYWNRCGNDDSVKCREYLYRPAAEGETASEEIPGFVRITAVADVKDGGQYLIAAKNDAGNWYVLNPTTSNNRMEYVAKVVGQSSVSSSEITFTGVGAGETEVQIGNTIYIINVTELVKKSASVAIGESESFTDETGYYVGADTSAIDESIATVEITGKVTSTDEILSENVTTIQSGKTYVLYNKVSNKLMNNTWADASVGGSGTDGLALRSNKTNFQDNDFWTITAVTGGYYVQDMNGKYLSIARGKAEVKDEPVVISLGYDGTDWTIGENGEYLNDFGGKHSAVAGWSDINDGNSQWEIYEVIEVPVDGTSTITFTGVAVGTTSVQIGDVLYTVTVTEESEVTDPTEPEASEPDASEPEASEPDASEPDASEPDASEPDASEPDASEPDASEPEDTKPEDTKPEDTKPEDTKPDASEPEYTVPECDKDDNCTLSQFEDIKVDDWYHDGIHFCVDEGIMNGMGEGKFAPNENTTRAQLVMMLYRLAGTPSVEGDTEPFTDVADTDWFYAPIVWAYKNKVVNGVTATEFAPNAGVTREQVATILHRYLGEPEGTGKLDAFPDVADVSEYAVAPLTWAVGEGLITGIAQADGTALLAPTGNATRAQIATILMRHLTAE